MKNGKTNNKITLQPKGPIKIQNIKLIIIPTIGNTRVSVAYYSFYDNIQLYEPLGKALLFTSSLNFKCHDSHSSNLGHKFVTSFLLTTNRSHLF